MSPPAILPLLWMGQNVLHTATLFKDQHARKEVDHRQKPALSWAYRDPKKTVAEMAQFGVGCHQTWGLVVYKAMNLIISNNSEQ